MNENGEISNFNYQGSTVSIRIQPGFQRVLDGSIVFDDSPAPERVFAVFSNNPLSFDQVAQAAREGFAEVKRRGGSLEEIERLPMDLPQASILFLKQ